MFLGASQFGQKPSPDIVATSEVLRPHEFSSHSLCLFRYLIAPIHVAKLFDVRKGTRAAWSVRSSSLARGKLNVLSGMLTTWEMNKYGDFELCSVQEDWTCLKIEKSRLYVANLLQQLRFLGSLHELA